MQVVGGHQGQLEGARDAQEVLAVAALDAEAVVHELAEVVARPEDVAVVGGGGERAVVVARLQPAVDLAGRAAGGADDPPAVGLEEIAVHAGLAVEALEARQAGEPEQVVQALVVLRPQGHVGVGLPPLAGALAVLARALVVAPAEVERRALEAALRGVVALDADDRLHAGRGAALVEVVGAVEVAVVGHRECRHAEARGLREQVAEAGRAVEHGVLGVHVQVHERVARHGAGLLPGVLDAGADRCWGGPRRTSPAPTGPGEGGRSEGLHPNPRHRRRDAWPDGVAGRSACRGRAAAPGSPAAPGSGCLRGRGR